MPGHLTEMRLPRRQLPQYTVLRCIGTRQSLSSLRLKGNTASLSLPLFLTLPRSFQEFSTHRTTFSSALPLSNVAFQYNACGGLSRHRMKGLLRSTAPCLERNVVRNTLADTPSGYVQDPRLSPKTMVRYDCISRVGAAALEAMEREKELLEREELAFPGYTTPRIQEMKRVVMEQNSTTADLESAVNGLETDLTELLKVVGQEVEKPMSQEHVLLLKWQQRQQRLHDREYAFRVAPEPSPRYRVVQQADGTEVVERPGHDTPQTSLLATDDAYLSQPVEMEDLPPEALVPERTVVTMHDVNHVRYLIGLALRRLSRFEEAERMFYNILLEDVTNMDAVESLLEMYLGLEGWVPRIRVLLDFLVTEYDKAILEGRMQRYRVNDRGKNGSADKGEEGKREKRVAEDGDTKGNGGSVKGNEADQPQAERAESPQSSRESMSNSHLSKNTLPTPGNAIARVRNGAPYTTVPQAAPIEVALSLLSDIIVEAAAQKCSTDGEGATSRFFIESLGPIVRALGRNYAPALLEALFQAVDEQHFMARFDSNDVSPAARRFALGLVIAFLKALTARRIHEMLPNSVQFEFFTLLKLHAALRCADRLHESYHICEKMIQLYRANSSLYRARLRRNRGEASLQSATAFLSDGQQQPHQQQALSAQRHEAAEDGCRPVTDRASSNSSIPSNETVPVLNSLRRLDGLEDNTVTIKAAVGDGGEAFVEPPDVLDDQDADYREAFFQYVNDRARDSPSLGRCLCLEAIREFPDSAAPWETLALLLHKENPEKNLHDAIIAARHAMLLEPLNLSVIVTLANFYKAARRYELHERMLDRYRLLVYMSEEGASAEDMLATAAEVEALDRETPEAQDLVEETGREMSEYMLRMEQAMTYSMPIDKEKRDFREAPIRFFSQQDAMRPPEVGEHESDSGENLQIGVAKRPLI